jgi:D-arabinose 1-dehydrogenase-like Zn-dependent alcohol dehydrogenase
MTRTERLCCVERAHLQEARFDEINRVLSELKAGKIDGRVVLELT